MTLRGVPVLLLLASCGPDPRCAAWLPPFATGPLPPGVREASGLAVSHVHPTWLWLLEDSGNAPVLRAVDRHGLPVGTLRVRNAGNVDWEDLASGPCGLRRCLYVADTGDNLASRHDAAVLRFPEPALAPGDAVDVDAERFPLRYPEGPQDAEALVVPADGRPVVITKRTDGTARVYRFPDLRPGVQVQLERLPDIDVKHSRGWLGTAATGASLDPEGALLFLRTYAGVWVFDVAGREPRDWHAAPRRAAPVPPEIQGEAIAFDARRPGLWSVSETLPPVLHYTACAPAR